jgi:hypothetical protein
MSIKKLNNSTAKTKAYNISLDFNSVEEVKKIITNTSFSQYLSDLIKEDLEKKKNIKSLSEIFGEDFEPITFINAKEEKKYYELIGLTNYEIKSK